MLKIISRELRDKIAITLSMFCILQCLFLPLLLTILPLLDVWWLADKFLHPFLLLIVVPLTILTLLPGYFQHRNFQPLLIATPALLLLVIGAFVPESGAEKVLTVVGALTLATAHILNISLKKKCSGIRCLRTVDT